MSKKEIKIVNLENVNYIVVDNEAFDWNVEPEQIKKVAFQIRNDPLMKESYLGSIFNHFTNCFSEFIGRKVSLQEIITALEEGYI